MLLPSFPFNTAVVVSLEKLIPCNVSAGDGERFPWKYPRCDDG